MWIQCPQKSKDYNVLELELRIPLSHLIWVLETEFVFFGRTTQDLDWSAISWALKGHSCNFIVGRHLRWYIRTIPSKLRYHTFSFWLAKMPLRKCTRKPQSRRKYTACLCDNKTCKQALYKLYAFGVIHWGVDNLLILPQPTQKTLIFPQQLSSAINSLQSYGGLVPVTTVALSSRV